jgi:hypothetical protein
MSEFEVEREEIIEFRQELSMLMRRVREKLGDLPYRKVSELMSACDRKLDDLDEILGGLSGFCEGCNQPLYSDDEYSADEDGCYTCMDCAPTEEDVADTPTHEATSEAPGPDSEAGEGWFSVDEYDLDGLSDTKLYEAKTRYGGRCIGTPAQLMARELHSTDPVQWLRELDEADSQSTADAPESPAVTEENGDFQSTGGEEDGPLASESPSSSSPENLDSASTTETASPSSSDSDLSISLDTGEASPFVFPSGGEGELPAQEEPTRFRESNWRDEIRAAGRAARAQGKPRWFNPYANGRGGNAEASDLWLGGYDEQAASESANAVKEEA